MKKLIAATVCVVPFALGGVVYAQGTKGPSGSGAENPSKQSRNLGTQQHGQPHTGATTSDSTDQGSKPASETTRPGGPDSMTSVAPAQPATPRTTEPDAGHNRSASGDAAGTEPRSRDDQGAR